VRPRKGVDRVRAPGERGLQERKRRLREGIDIDDALHAELLGL
jgi:LDH2 family malate/lactate/ureidoglycolate dehydrogenase